LNFTAACQFIQVLEENRTLAIHIFPSDMIATANFPLHTIVRQTRNVTILIKNQMTYLDALHDAVNKFTRMENHLGDDHTHFQRNYTFLLHSILKQERQLKYLAGVSYESAEGAYRAKKAYKETDFNLKKAYFHETEILKDLHCALVEHRHLCASS
jgi:hypothetical protein